MPLFTRVRRETVWKSGIGPEWGSESGQEEWKESPFGCILSPQRRAPDALETVWKSGIGHEWGSESGQEEWKESPFGCILSPQRRAPDALGYFPNSFLGYFPNSFSRHFGE